MQTYSYSAYAKQLSADKAKLEAVPAVIRRTVAARFPGAFLKALSSLKRPPVDRGGYRRSAKVMQIPGGAKAYSTSPYAAIIEWGRRPGARMPPVKIIAEWLVRKGLVDVGKKSKKALSPRQHFDLMKQVMQVAWAVARAIGRRGLPARLIFTAASREVDAAVRAEIARHLRGGAP